MNQLYGRRVIYPTSSIICVEIRGTKLGIRVSTGRKSRFRAELTGKINFRPVNFRGDVADRIRKPSWAFLQPSFCPFEMVNKRLLNFTLVVEYKFKNSRLLQLVPSLLEKKKKKERKNRRDYGLHNVWLTLLPFVESEGTILSRSIPILDDIQMHIDRCE